MAGLALVLDLLRATVATTKSIHSFSSLTASSAALSASLGVTFLPSYPAYSPQFQPRDWAGQFVVCEEAEDTGEPWAQPDARWLSQWELKENGGVPKAYHVELKPLFSAFRPRALGATAVRACLVNFLPLLEAYMQQEEDDLEDDAERPASLSVDPVVPLKGSASHILREVAVITTRRVLERVTVHYASPRMAWKLLKGHALGVIANWVVQLVLDVYRYLQSSVPTSKSEERKKGAQDSTKHFNRLMRKTAGNTLKGGASLVLASFGAGLGTILIKPSIGTWIGCAAGDLAGPYLIAIWFDAWIFFGTFSPPSQDP